MLGDKVGSLVGKTTTGVLPANGALPRFTTSGECAGSLAGADVQMMATYAAEMNVDGSLYGECPNQGLIMAADGVATFRASGVGRFTEDGGAKFRGVAYFQTSAASLTDLNGKAYVYHWDVDAEGSATWDIWEWK